MRRWIVSFLMEVLSGFHLFVCGVFLQEEFDGVLREEVVASALHQLGRSGSGTEQVYLNLTLSVSMTRAPWAGYTLILVGPYLFFLVLIAFGVAPDLRVLHLMETDKKSDLCNMGHQRALGNPGIRL